MERIDLFIYFHCALVATALTMLFAEIDICHEMTILLPISGCLSLATIFISLGAKFWSKNLGMPGKSVPEVFSRALRWVTLLCFLVVEAAVVMFMIGVLSTNTQYVVHLRLVCVFHRRFHTRLLPRQSVGSRLSALECFARAFNGGPYRDSLSCCQQGRA